MTEKCLTVRDLIRELSLLDGDLEIVVPSVPYNQPEKLYKLGVVIITKEEESNVKAGEYIGLNIGYDLDDETMFEEESGTIIKGANVMNTEGLQPEQLKTEIIDNINKNPIDAINMDEFISKIEQLTKENKL